MSLPLFLPGQIAVGQESLMKAATRYLPGVNWRQSSVVLADFACVGHKQQAILGTNSTDIVIAIFINGMGFRPELLRYSARIRNPADAKLTTEGLDYDPEVEVGYELPGFKRGPESQRWPRRFCAHLLEPHVPPI